MAARTCETISIAKRAAEAKTYKLRWQDLLAIRWQPTRIYALNAVVRPVIADPQGRLILHATGFEYLCVQAGQVLGTPPDWATDDAQVFSDGSAKWKSQAVSAASIDGISSVAFTASVPSGLTIQDLGDDATALETAFRVSAGTGLTEYEFFANLATAGGDTVSQRILCQMV